MKSAKLHLSRRLSVLMDSALLVSSTALIFLHNASVANCAWVSFFGAAFAGAAFAFFAATIFFAALAGVVFAALGAAFLAVTFFAADLAAGFFVVECGGIAVTPESLHALSMT